MTGRMSRNKGNRTEREVVTWLRNNGFPWAERKGTGLPGADVAELGPGLELEIKNHQRLEPAAWVDQLLAAMATTEAGMGAVIAKRRGTTNVGDWYGILPARLLIQLLREAGYGDPIDEAP
ncbi:MAG: hypothetical protein AAGE88_18320 [Actinomycetota bacterium]